MTPPKTPTPEERARFMWSEVSASLPDGASIEGLIQTTIKVIRAAESAAYRRGLERGAELLDRRAVERDAVASRGDEAACYEAGWCRADAAAIRREASSSMPTQIIEALKSFGRPASQEELLQNLRPLGVSDDLFREVMRDLIDAGAVSLTLDWKLKFVKNIAAIRREAGEAK